VTRIEERRGSFEFSDKDRGEKRVQCVSSGIAMENEYQRIDLKRTSGFKHWDNNCSKYR
jgi:hypothetical protein